MMYSYVGKSLNNFRAASLVEESTVANFSVDAGLNVGWTISTARDEHGGHIFGNSLGSELGFSPSIIGGFKAKYETSIGY